MKKTLLACLVVVPLVAAGCSFGSDSDSESSRDGTCGNATYELTADDGDDGVDVNFDLQSGAPGETWLVVIEQDGTEVFSSTRQTDEDSEIDVDVTVPSKDGSSFTATATQQNGAVCTASLDH